MPDILEYAEQGDSASVIRSMRVRSLFSPYYFEKIVLGCDKMVDHLHGAELELFVNNLLEGKRKQWIQWPRGHYKTTCFTIGLGIWFVLPHDESDREFAISIGIDPIEWDKRMTLHNQDFVQLLAFENITNASRKLAEIKMIFESNQFFRACFPEIAYKGDENPWSTSALRIRRKPGTRLVGESTFQAIGVSAAVQSQHYDIIWEDDPVGEAAIKSPIVMQDTISWHGRLNGAMNGPNLGMGTWRFGISNVWGFHDLNAHVQVEEPDFVFHTRSVYEYDEKTGMDQPIFPEQFPWKTIQNIRTSAGMTKRDFACTPAGSPILMSDWNEKPIEAVEVGDEVIGFERNGKNPHFVRSTVLATGHKTQEVVRVDLESGASVYCTPDHLWWNAKKIRPGEKRYEYSVPKVGRRMFRIYKPFPAPNAQQQRDWDWLGGIIDGEGSIQNKGCITITQSEEHNPEVCKMLVEVLNRLGIKFVRYERAAFDKFGKSSKASTLYIIHGGRGMKRVLLIHARMAKKHKILDALWAQNHQISAPDRAVKITPVGVQTVYWLETTSGNYINQGYASKNCQYLNKPIAPGDNEITTDNIHRYAITENAEIVCSCGLRTYASHLKRYMHYDPYNAKGATSTSAPAIAVVGLSTNKHVFLLDYFVAKGEYSKIYDQLVTYNDMYWPEIMTYEDVGHQNMTEFYLRQLQKTQEFRDAKHKQFRRIMAVGTKGRAKEIRIRDSLFPTFEHGKFAIREKHQTFLDMIATFPHRVPGHDYDLLDALAQGGGVWKFPVDEDTEKQTKLDEEAVLAELGKPYGYHSPHVN